MEAEKFSSILFFIGVAFATLSSPAYAAVRKLPPGAANFEFDARLNSQDVLRDLNEHFDAISDGLNPNNAPLGKLKNRLLARIDGTTQMPTSSQVMAAWIMDGLLAQDDHHQFRPIYWQLERRGPKDSQTPLQKWVKQYNPDLQRREKIHYAMKPLRAAVQAMTEIGYYEKLKILDELFGRSAPVQGGGLTSVGPGADLPTGRYTRRQYDKLAGGWATYLAFLDQSLMRKIQTLYTENGLTPPRGARASIRHLERLSGIADDAELYRLQGTLAEILVVDSLLGEKKEEIVAMNYPINGAEFDVVTKIHLIEISAGRLYDKERQFDLLAFQARQEGLGLILYYDPARANFENIGKLTAAASRHGIKLELRTFEFH